MVVRNCGGHRSNHTTKDALNLFIFKIKILHKTARRRGFAHERKLVPMLIREFEPLIDVDLFQVSTHQEHELLKARDGLGTYGRWNSIAADSASV